MMQKCAKFACADTLRYCRLFTLPIEINKEPKERKERMLNTRTKSGGRGGQGSPGPAPCSFKSQFLELPRLVTILYPP